MPINHQPKLLGVFQAVLLLLTRVWQHHPRFLSLFCLFWTISIAYHSPYFSCQFHSFPYPNQSCSYFTHAIRRNLCMVSYVVKLAPSASSLHKESELVFLNTNLHVNFPNWNSSNACRIKFKSQYYLALLQGCVPQKQHSFAHSNTSSPLHIRFPYGRNELLKQRAGSIK